MIQVKDATAALIVVLLLFVIPSNPDFIYIFSKDENKRPKIPSHALLTWKVPLNKKKYNFQYYRTKFSRWYNKNYPGD